MFPSRPPIAAILLLLLGTVAVSEAQTPLSQVAADRLPTCLACHGDRGHSATDGVPSLGAMPVNYVLTQLYLFREKIRKVEIMNAMAEGLTDDDLRSLAATINALPPPRPAAPVPEAERTTASNLVERYHCNSCHGAQLEGQVTIPRIAGQREDYLAAALAGYKSNARRGYSPAMNEAAQEIADPDIPVLARYIASLP